MSKIKTLSLFFVFLLLLCTLSSCGEDPYYKFSPDLEPLTEEQIEACNEDYREDYFGSYDEYAASKSGTSIDEVNRIYYGMKFIQNNVYTPYLGTFGGAIVCGNAMNVEAEEYLLGSHNFESGSLKRVKVYKDGKFVSLSKAYENGWITDADVKVIEDRIVQYDASFAK